LFATEAQVNSVDGALRDTGFEPERITVVGYTAQGSNLPLDSGRQADHTTSLSKLPLHLLT
jgi:hypothetical protein